MTANICNTYMSRDRIITHLQRYMHDKYSTHDCSMIDILISIYDIAQAFNNREPTIEEWYSGAEIIIANQKTTYFNGEFHVFARNDERHLLNNEESFITDKAKEINNELCQYVIDNKLFSSSLVIDENMLHTWAKSTINEVVDTSAFYKVCIDDIQYKNGANIVKCMNNYELQLKYYNNIVKQLIDMKNIIIVIFMIQLLLSFMTFAKAEDNNTDHNNTHCYTFENVEICVEDLPCEFCDKPVDPITLTLEFNRTFGINM